HLVGRDADAVDPRIVLGDGLAQFEEAEAVRIARAAVLERLFQRVAHHRRRLEIRLAVFEMHDVDARALEHPRALRHFDGEERLDVADAARGAGRHRLRSSRATRRRAASICHSMRGPSLRTPTLLAGWSSQFTATSTTCPP